MQRKALPEFDSPDLHQYSSRANGCIASQLKGPGMTSFSTSLYRIRRAAFALIPQPGLNKDHVPRLRSGSLVKRYTFRSRRAHSVQVRSGTIGIYLFPFVRTYTDTIVENAPVLMPGCFHFQKKRRSVHNPFFSAREYISHIRILSFRILWLLYLIHPRTQRLILRFYI